MAEKIDSPQSTQDQDITALKRERPELFIPIPLRRGESEANPNGVPTGTVEDWRGKDNPSNRIDIIDSGEPLVNIGSLNPPIFAVNSYFNKLDESGYSERLDGATLAQYARESVVKQLETAQNLLPAGYKLVVFDSWRSLETQYATYELCFASLVERLISEGIIAPDESLAESTKEIISRETQKYISLPSPLPEKLQPTPEQVSAGRLIPSPHNTGGSVDVSIVQVDFEWRKRLADLEDAIGQIDDPFSPDRAMLNFEVSAIYRLHSTPLEFGTEFDFAGDRAGLTYLESTSGLSGQDIIARDNRRMLYNIMTRAGFMPYADEWWHYNTGNQMAEMTKWRETGIKGIAKFGSSSLDAVQQHHEKLHQELFQALCHLAEHPDLPIVLSPEITDLGGTPELIATLSTRVGDPRVTKNFRKSYDMRYRGKLPKEFVQSVKSAQQAI